MSKHLSALALSALATSTIVLTLVGAAPQAQACSSTPNMGSICYTAARYCPTGYLPVSGQALTISSNEALYSLLGTTFGGSGAQFNAPDLRGRTPVGVGQSTGTTLPVTLGQYRGVENTQLTVAQLPAHTHQVVMTGITTSNVQVISTITASTNPGTSNIPTAATPYLAKTSVGNGLYETTAGTQPVNVGGVTVSLSPQPSTTAVVNTVTGGSNPLSMRPPSMALIACIASSGIYPSRQ